MSTPTGGFRCTAKHWRPFSENADRANAVVD